MLGQIYVNGWSRVIASQNEGSIVGVLSQAPKNKTYTPKNICSSASKDRSHGEYLA